MSIQTRHFRIFISSPSDVVQERQGALAVIDHLLYEPAYKDKISINIVAWDKPGGGTPLLATMNPQAAINAGLPKPSECDIVVVIFWSRMGTPLPLDYKKSDGSSYLSGTEWEYEDAILAARSNGRPEVIIYKRTEQLMFNPDDTDFASRVQQYQRVKDFFAKFRDEKTGAFLQGYNEYKKPEDFRVDFESHLRITIDKLLKVPPVDSALTTKDVILEPVIWEGSPFPGLEAFSEKQAPIFFGRGREIDALVEKVAANRFVAVVGASGSGKSSLVGAGLIPRLKSNAISSENVASKDWLFIRFTPQDNPFLALAEAMINSLPELKGDPIEFIERAEKLANVLKDKPENLAQTIKQSLRNLEKWAEILIFVDQFEELFTLSTNEATEAFARMLTYASSKVRVVVTLRADFYHRALEIPTLADKLREGSLPLAMPDQFALLEMIDQPAKRADLVFEKDLAKRIVQDTGTEPGALALMAYALDELYHSGKDKRQLTHHDYEAIGSVQGAIGKRAQATFDTLSVNQQAAISFVFRELVEVNERGIATRQRAMLSRFAGNANAIAFISAFIHARLLVASRRGLSSNDPVIEVAHEALLRSWPRLAQWIDDTQDDLRLLRQVRNAAYEWNDNGRPESFLWQHERLQPVYNMQERLGIEFDDVVQDFIQPEAERLLIEFKQLSEEKSLRTMLYRQMNIVDRFAEIGEHAIQCVRESQLYASGSVRDAIDKILKDFENFPTEKLLRTMLEGSDNYSDAIINHFNGIANIPSNFPKLLWKFIVSSDIELQNRALNVAIDLNMEALVPALKELLVTVQTPPVQLSVLRALVHLLAEEDKIIELLGELACRPDPVFRQQAIDYASRLAYPKHLTQVVLDMLAKIALDDDFRKQVELNLAESLKNNHDSVMIRNALNALNDFKHPNRVASLLDIVLHAQLYQAIPQLRKVLFYFEPEGPVCQSTVQILIKFETEDAIQLLCEYALQRRGQLGIDIAEWLLQFIRDGKTNDSEEFANLFWSISRGEFGKDLKSVALPLITIVEDYTLRNLVKRTVSNRHIVDKDISTLVLVGDKATRLLEIAILDAKNAWRVNAAYVLGRIADPFSVRYLKQALYQDPSSLTRLAILKALNEINTPEAIDVVNEWQNPP